MRQRHQRTWSHRLQVLVVFPQWVDRWRRWQREHEQAFSKSQTKKAYKIKADFENRLVSFSWHLRCFNVKVLTFLTWISPKICQSSKQLNSGEWTLHRGSSSSCWGRRRHVGWVCRRFVLMDILDNVKFSFSAATFCPQQMTSWTLRLHLELTPLLPVWRCSVFVSVLQRFPLFSISD